MKNFFENDYRTAEDQKVTWLSHLPLGSTLSFYSQAYKIVNSSAKNALKGNYEDSDWCKSSTDILQAAEYSGGKIEVNGIENLKDLKKPVVFVGNHMSTLETFLLPGIIVPYSRLSFVIKDSLVNAPIFGPVMRAVNPILVTRTNVRQDLKTVLQQGQDNLKKGFSICIFPQSTRMPVFNEALFNSLGAKLAKRAEVDLIPIAVKTDFWKTGHIIKDIGRIDTKAEIKISFGKKLSLDDGVKVVHKQTVEFIKSHLTSWGLNCINDRNI